MKLKPDLTSLQGKITAAYVTLVVCIVILALIAFWDSMYLKQELRSGVIVADLKDAILAIRREEKNLFLYANQQALIRVTEHVDSSLDIVENYQVTLKKIMQQATPDKMSANLKTYRDNLNNWGLAAEVDRPALKKRIQAQGQQLYAAVETLSQQERQALEKAVQKSQLFLLSWMLIISFAIFIVGRQLKKVALKPLERLESNLMPIAEGRFTQLDTPSHDREFVTFTDAFNRMLKELEIRQRRMLQSEKLASLGILSAGVAHELNNPLSNISSSCQLLMEELQEASPEQLNIWLKQIDSETERGRRIVHTLLDFGGKKVFQKETLSLKKIIIEIKTIMRKTLRQHGVELTLNIPLNLVLVVDKQRIQQLFINLIQNAINATKGGMKLTISAASRNTVSPSLLPENAEVSGDLNCIADNNDTFVEILLSDNGPGISKNILSKVFDPFFTTSEPGKGVGLGLFIVQEIVREHGGCLAITSRPGKGTQVILFLPGESVTYE